MAKTPTEPKMPPNAASAGSGPQRCSRLLEILLAPDRVAELAEAQAGTHLRIKERRERLRAIVAQERGLITADLGQLDALATKVQRMRYQGYVLCEETPGVDDGGNPATVVRRMDTDKTWFEPVKFGQTAFTPEPPAAPPEVKGKRCTCPTPENAEPRETWHCPEHKHMWSNPGGKIEPAPADPMDALAGEGA